MKTLLPLLLLLANTAMAQFTLNVSVQDVDCHGASTGSIQVFPDGGGTPHHYTWSTGVSGNNLNSLTGLSAGAYSVSVYGSIFGPPGTVVAHVTITEPPQLQITNISTQDVACKGDASGSAVVTTQGGTGNPPSMFFTYDWQGNGYASPNNDTATGMPAGNYTLVVSDARGCTALNNFTITEPSDSLVASLNNTPATCNNTDGELTVVATSQGSGNLMYNWNTNQTTAAISGLSADSSYRVTVTDAAGCELVLEDSISGSSLSGYIDTIPSDCNQDNGQLIVVLQDSSRHAIQYSWNTTPAQDSNIISDLTAGDVYTVTITDTLGCILVLTDTVAGSEKLAATIVDNQNGTSTATVTGGFPPYQYQWSLAGLADSAATILTSVSSNLPILYVTVTDAAGCTVVDTMIFLNVLKMEQLSKFELYPNPNKGQFIVDVVWEQDQEGSIQISNMLGQVIEHRTVKTRVWRETINLKESQAGLYLVQLQVKGQVITRLVRLE